MILGTLWKKQTQRVYLMKNLQILYLENLTSTFENVLAFPVQLVAPRHLAQGRLAEGEG